MTIKTRLLSLIIIIITIMLSVGVTGWWMVQELNSEVERIMRTRLPLMRKSANLSETLLEQMMLIRQIVYMSHKDNEEYESSMTRFRQTGEEFDRNLDALKNIIKQIIHDYDSQGEPLHAWQNHLTDLTTIGGYYSRFRQSVDTLILNMNSDKKNNLEIILDQTFKDDKKLDKLVTMMVDDIDQLNQNSLQTAHAQKNMVFNIIAAAMTLGFLFVVAMAWFIWHLIWGRLAQANEMVQLMAKEQWLGESKKEGNDEFGQFLASLRQAAQSLRENHLLREKNHQELLRSNAELQQFAYIASHDLQEPLRTIASFAQLLAERYRDKLDQDATEFIDFMVDAAGRMQQLINDLLVYSRVSTRAKPSERVNSHKLIQDVINQMQIVIEENHAKVEIIGSLPYIESDPLQFMQLSQNLLSNGIKFHRNEPPLVQISVARHEAEWVFQFYDNGIGIEPQYADRIFEIFQRLHTREEYPGTGIGLAVCKKIVERHGGRIWMEPGNNGGTVFYFSWPMKGS